MKTLEVETLELYQDYTPFQKGIIILLSGKMYSGKDTVADIICKNYNFKKIAFADEVKNIASKCFGWDGIKDEKGRRLLQTIGTEAGRYYNPDIWVDKLINRIEFEMNEVEFLTEYSVLKNPFNLNFVISDHRFPNEYEKIKLKLNKEYDVYRIRIERSIIFIEELNNEEYENINEYHESISNELHESEQQFDNMDFDYLISNNGTLQQLEIKVKNIIQIVYNKL